MHGGLELLKLRMVVGCCVGIYVKQIKLTLNFIGILSQRSRSLANFMLCWGGTLYNSSLISSLIFFLVKTLDLCNKSGVEPVLDHRVLNNAQICSTVEDIMVSTTVI